MSIDGVKDFSMMKNQVSFVLAMPMVIMYYVKKDNTCPEGEGGESVRKSIHTEISLPTDSKDSLHFNKGGSDQTAKPAD